MCIICRMKEAGATEEVVAIAKELCNVAQGVLDEFKASHQAKDKALTEKHNAACKNLYDVLHSDIERPSLQSILQELLGADVTVKVMRVETEEQLQEIIAKVEGDDNQPTVH